MNDSMYMTNALELAETVAGQQSPNPAVGAVVVKDGEVVGIGAHLKVGEAHAEVHALQMAGKKAKGATIYVTLEPCSHYGKTPPCADLIIEYEIARCVIATQDPDARVSGKGIAKLQHAGIEVETGLHQVRAATLYRKFFRYVRSNRPYVTIKSASSLDGKTATAAGESKWITSAEAREDGHQLRADHDAILTGIQTVLADDPSLTVRLPGINRQPKRIILDSGLQMRPNAKMLTDNSAPVFIYTGADASHEKQAALEKAGAKVVRLKKGPYDVTSVLKDLASLEVTSLLIEGGSTVIGSFIQYGYVDEWVSYTAPLLLAGKEAVPSAGGEGISQLADALPMEVVHTGMAGPDIKIVARRTEEI
ncbi:bifunctional diaminohydroxyphosphoribosylaminopyrimidine deaminase/5-amino-6-(5-phosphoribosylamino)uracil reductase RibD [Salsuginibacillus kocurii]|uniref:bifunctional diaminohydroxyphosphoribosylaminopyrimidine deaminase/5-amino-6-(5-phosphoribosylamino)uracil reductase RibD n=1 Tax=Salsuginibacillus kocurii TaxID=427078 RepID=UPI00036E37BC|nr:bifunctional diaminohydroxyphosphoribosylaminopyrimidine deaminase/5-amino-6-(5-phosphoribosylamino)uracil reductase RibD [Salsuginibacillus kocurii]